MLRSCFYIYFFYITKEKWLERNKYYTFEHNEKMIDVMKLWQILLNMFFMTIYKNEFEAPLKFQCLNAQLMLDDAICMFGIFHK